MEEKKNEKHCLQCLLREMDKNAYMENLYEYISHLDENIKADGALYEERLNVCKECKYLEMVCAVPVGASWSCGQR